MIDSRLPPHSDDAERSVLGAILVEGKVVTDVLPLVNAEDFYSTPHQKIFAACAQLHNDGKTVDAVLIKAELEQRGDLEKIGGEAYLAQLAAQVPSVAGALDYAKIVQEYAIRRRVWHLSAELREAASRPNGLEGILAAEDRLRTILSSSPRKRAPLIFKDVSALGDGGPDVKWTCRGLLAKGYVTLLVGKPKKGKSTLTFALLAAVEGGVPFFGLETEQATAIYVSEESPRTIRQKATRFGLQKALYLDRGDAYPRRPLRELVAAAVEKAREVGATVIVIDTLAMWAGLAPEEENDAGSIQAAIDIALRAAGEGFAVLLVHHARKAPGEDSDMVRGSGGIAGGADIIVTLGSHSGEDRTFRTLRVVGRDEDCPDELVIRLAERRYEPVGTADEVKAKNVRDAVLNVLPVEPDEGLPLQEVRKRTKARKEFVLKVLGDLVKEGIVGATGTGKRGSPFSYYLKAVPGSGSGSRPYWDGSGTESEAEAREPDGKPEDWRSDAVPASHREEEEAGTESERPSTEVPPASSASRAVSVPVPAPYGGGTGTGTDGGLPWLGYAPDLAVLWDDLWSRWQERAAILEHDGGLPREEAERRAWADVAAPTEGAP